MREFPASNTHLVPDAVLYHHAIDVLEQATAVETLTASGEYRASYANARSAMEAAQDMLFLVAEESEYDRYGSLARCFELLEIDALKQRMAKADESMGLTPPGWPPAIEIVERDAEAWEAENPGMGSVLREAFVWFEHDPSRQRRHWSGLSRRDLAERVATAYGASPGWAEMHDALYGLASIHTHPRSRSGSRSAEREGDTVVFSPQPDDGGPSKLASMACLFAKDALDKRLTFFFPPSSAT